MRDELDVFSLAVTLLLDNVNPVALPENVQDAVTSSPVWICLSVSPVAFPFHRTGRVRCLSALAVMTLVPPVAAIELGDAVNTKLLYDHAPYSPYDFTPADWLTVHDLLLPSTVAVIVMLRTEAVVLLLAVTVLPDNVNPDALPLRTGVLVSVSIFVPLSNTSRFAVAVMVLVPPAAAIVSGDALTVITQSPYVVVPLLCVTVTDLLIPLY